MSPRVVRSVVAGAAALAVAVAVKGGMQPLSAGALIVSAPAFLIAVGMADVLGAWRQSRRIAGARRSLSLAWLMTRVRHRAPFRALKSYGPAFISALPLLLGAWLVATSWSGSMLNAEVYVGGIAIGIGLLSFLILVAPPAVLFLGASQYDEFRLMKRVHVEARCFVMSLANQASASVLGQYDAHYEGVRTNMPPVARAVARAVAPFVDRTAPRFDSLRTRTGLWRRTVLDFIDRVPIVLVDARSNGRQVQQEALWMLGASRRDRALFVCEPDGSAPLFERLREMGVTLHADRVRIAPEDRACAMVADATIRRSPLPPLLPVADEGAFLSSIEHAEAEWRAMGNAFEAVLTRLRAGSGPDRELDADICRACRISEREPPSDVPALTASLDAALALADAVLAGRPGRHSYRIDINTDGTASASLGFQDRPGNLVILETRAGDSLSPPRAVLDVLVQALLA